MKKTLEKKEKPIKKIKSNLVPKELALELTRKACKQFEESSHFKQPRMEDIQAGVDLYDNKTKPAGRGRFNVPVPVMAGFVDTLMSKIDEGVKLNFKYTNLANLTKAKKMQACWEKESGPTRGKWDKVDRAVKKNAIFSGVGIYENYSESDPEYKNHFRGIHYLDFHCEPLGGQDLENHLFKGVENVFKTKSELESAVESGLYYKWGVEAVVSKSGKDEQKRNVEIFKNKINLYTNLGLNPENHSYVGEPVYNLNKWVLTHNGKDYYLVFDYFTKQPVRCQELKTLNPSGRSPWVTWHTHSDLLNFWSKAPCDDVRPTAEAINILFNQALDNRHKKNFGMRAVDAEMFPDLSALDWRPDGVVPVNTNGGLRPISTGIYEFQTEEVGGTIDLINFMDNIVGQKSGVTADAQGESEEKRVGIYYGNLQQVADRLGLYNKSYAEGHAQIGNLFQEGVRMDMTVGYMVKWIGEDGAVSEGEMERDDAIVEGEGENNEFAVDVVGGMAEMRANDIKSQKRTDSLNSILANPTLAVKLNPTWAIKQILANGEYEKEEVQMATDLGSDGVIEQFSRASKAIQDILAGKKPKRVRTADTSFVQKIMDYAIDQVDDMKTFDALMGYAEEHIEIATQNQIRKGRIQAVKMQLNAAMQQNGQPQPGGQGGPAVKPTAPAGSPEGTASMSQNLGDMAPGSPSTLTAGQ